MSDPHYNARGMFETVEIDGEPLKIPAILPKLSETPAHRLAGAKIGAQTAKSSVTFWGYLKPISAASVTTASPVNT